MAGNDLLNAAYRVAYSTGASLGASPTKATARNHGLRITRPQGNSQTGRKPNAVSIV